MTFELVTDRPALNFVPTIAERGTTNLERLRTGDDLREWAREAGLVDDLVVTPADLGRARALREAVFGVVSALIEGRPPAPADVAALNAAAARRGPVVRLEEDGRLTRSGDVAAVLSVIATDCLDLCVSPDRHVLRWCDDERCTRPFVDRSRGGRRRWCGMKGCGDRAKAAAYRERRRRHDATTARD